VLSLGNRPVLVLGLLLAGALVTFFLPPPWRRSRRLFAAAVLLLAGWAAVSMASPLSSGPVVSSYGDAVSGVPLALRADLTGLVLAVMSLLAALLALFAGDRQPGEEAALLVTAAGAALAAFAGNAVLLFGGAEIASLGGLLVTSAGRGRVSRGAGTAFAIQHIVALGLLVAAAELLAATGTSDPYAVPQSAVGFAVALPWGVAGAGRLLAVGWWPGAAGGRSTRSWLAIGAVPSGAAVLLRLHAATGGVGDPGLTVVLAVVGAGAALWGAVVAWRGQREARRAGRGLLAASAGTLVALAGLRGGAGAFATGLVALELALLAAPAWSQPARPGRAGRAVAAAALAGAGGLPLGFGATAAALELGLVAASGTAYSALLLALGAATLMAAAAGLVAARQALGGVATAPPDGQPARPERASSPLRMDAVLALGLGAAAALLPGVVGSTVLGPLAGGEAPIVVDAGTLHGPGGSWPGGYLSLAFLFVLAGVVSAGLLAGRPFPRPAHAGPGPRPRPAWLAALGMRRAARPAFRMAGLGLSRTDSWLISQPGLAFTVIVAVIALVASHFL